MIANLCLADNTISRSFRKTSMFCEQCGRRLRKISMYEVVGADGETKLVLEEVQDE